MSLMLVCVGVWVLSGYLLSRWVGRNDVADILWGLGFLAVSVSTWIFSGPAVHSIEIRWVALGLVTVWALRLSGHLFLRMNRAGWDPKHEDTRYVAWRKGWGKKEPIRALTRVFLLQGVLLWGATLSLFSLFSDRSPESATSWLSWLGLVVGILGFGLEATADAQLTAFRGLSRAERPSVLRDGVWAWCRHPNYAGEIILAWGLALISWDVSRQYWIWLSPVLMTFLLTRVSGVPMLEAGWAQRGPEFLAYLKSTRAWLPFGFRQLLAFLGVVVSLLLLDLVWLSWIAGPTYLRLLGPLARTVADGSWDPHLPSVVLVYLLLALGIQALCFQGAKDRATAFWRGLVLGLVVYGVYDLTNTALIVDWPRALVALDMVWGAALCGFVALGLYRRPLTS